MTNTIIENRSESELDHDGEPNGRDLAPAEPESLEELSRTVTQGDEHQPFEATFELERGDVREFLDRLLPILARAGMLGVAVHIDG
jgi:hypothetical protein